MNCLLLYWGRKGGGARYTLEVARALSEKAGVNLHLSVSNQCEMIDEFEELNRPVLRVDTFRHAPGFVWRFFAARTVLRKQLENYLKEQAIDVLMIGMDFFWGPMIYKACSRAGVKTVFTAHEPKPHPKEPVLMKMMKQVQLKKAIRGADSVIALTGHVKKFIIDEYGVSASGVHVIPHGIFSYYQAENPKKLPLPPEFVKLLFFGRIDYYKGVDILLEAFRLLEEKHKNLCLEIWGAGDLEPYRKQADAVRNLRIENRWIDEEEIPGIFEKNHICVLPYREASQSGIVGIAASAGMPIAACPDGGLMEQMETTGAVFSKDFTPQALARAIDRLLENPVLYEACSAKALGYAETMSWGKIAEEMHHVFENIIRG